MRMAADWDKLAKESPSDVFIADVNCGDEIDVSSFQIIDDDALLHVWYDTVHYYNDNAVLMFMFIELQYAIDTFPHMTQYFYFHLQQNSMNQSYALITMWKDILPSNTGSMGMNTITTLEDHLTTSPPLFQMN